MTTTSDASSTASDASSTDADAGRKRDATVLSGPDDDSEEAEGATTDATAADETTVGAPTDEADDSSSLADKLDTAGTIIWTGFLAAIVVFTLIPVVGLAAGYAPFDPPPTLPYFALVGFALVGAAALVGGAILDV
ncbi:hypothetical protein [Halorussus salinus]|uniref:hypothetical protein n=1 Tax=Halorussus salinus TaxID=1364935 RepID=UPI0010926F89|nr:hypothetical protein [Halorussus salinus]